MDIVKDLKDALKAVEAAKNSLGGELDKGGNLPWAYNQLRTAEQIPPHRSPQTWMHGITPSRWDAKQRQSPFSVRRDPVDV